MINLKHIVIWILIILFPITPALFYELFIFDFIYSIAVPIGEYPGFFILILLVFIWSYPFFRFYKTAINYGNGLAFLYAGTGISLFTTCMVINLQQNFNTILLKLNNGWIFALTIGLTAVTMFLLAEVLVRIFIKKPKSSLGRTVRKLGIINLVVMVTVIYTYITFYFFEAFTWYLWVSFALVFMFGFAMKVKLEGSFGLSVKPQNAFISGCLGIFMFYAFYVGLSSNFMDAWLVNIYTADLVYNDANQISLSPISYLALDTGDKIPRGIYLIEGFSSVLTVFMGIVFIGPVFAYFWHTFVANPIEETGHLLFHLLGNEE